MRENLLSMAIIGQVGQESPVEDVVAQLVKATGLHQTATQQFRVRSRLTPQSPEGQLEL
jgi:hypothetical protein